MFIYVLKRLYQNFSLHSRELNEVVTSQQLIGKKMEGRGDVLNTIRALVYRTQEKRTGRSLICPQEVPLSDAYGYIKDLEFFVRIIGSTL